MLEKCDILGELFGELGFGGHDQPCGRGVFAHEFGDYRAARRRADSGVPGSIWYCCDWHENIN